MKARDQKFGIEIEMTGITREMAARKVAEVIGGTWHSTGDGYDTYIVKDRFGRKWKLMSDSSIRSESNFPMGTTQWRAYLNSSYQYRVELVSPILTYDKMKTLKAIVKALKDIGAIVNDSCGIHIHVDASNHDFHSLKNLIQSSNYRETYLKKAFNVLPNRESYCRGNDAIVKRDIGKVQTMSELQRLWYHDYHNIHGAMQDHYNGTRYHMVNIHNVWFRGTVEFRLFNATLDMAEITAYIDFVLGYSAKAINDSGFGIPREKDEKKNFIRWINRMGITEVQDASTFKVLTKNFE